MHRLCYRYAGPLGGAGIRSSRGPRPKNTEQRMATYYWRGTNGGFVLPAGWQMPNGMGMMAAAAQPPDENDVAVLDTTGMALSADASFGGVFHLDLPGAAGVLNLNGHR